MNIDPDKRAVIVGGKPHRLPRRVYDLIEVMAARPGRVWTRGDLMNAVGMPLRNSDRSVDSIVKHARKHLVSLTGRQFIQSMWGVGYYWEDGQ